MAETRDVLYNGKDRLERFSVRNETSDSMKIVGYSVKLAATYQAEIQMIKDGIQGTIAKL